MLLQQRLRAVEVGEDSVEQAGALDEAGFQSRPFVGRQNEGQRDRSVQRGAPRSSSKLTVAPDSSSWRRALSTRSPRPAGQRADDAQDALPVIADRLLAGDQFVVSTCRRRSEAAQRLHGPAGGRKYERSRIARRDAGSTARARAQRPKRLVEHVYCRSIHSCEQGMPFVETTLIGALQGSLLTPGRPSGLGVVVLGGSSGRVDVARAGLLADRGALAIAMRWFGGEGQSPGICEIPLETFALATDRLIREGCDRIALLGTSKGAEAALLVASYDPRIDAVVAFEPVVGRVGEYRPRHGRHRMAAAIELHSSERRLCRSFPTRPRRCSRSIVGLRSVTSSSSRRA